MHERNPMTAAVNVVRFPTDDDESRRTGTHAYADLEILSLATPTSPSTLHSTESLTSSLPKLHKNVDPRDCIELEDYYRKYDADRAKQLIDTLPFSKHEICSKCAKFEESPVYSDRFFYKGRPLLAKEMMLNNSNLNKNGSDFMPVHKIVKSNAAGIFYSISPPSDVPDLKTSLEPSILLLEPPVSATEASEITKRKSRAHLRLPLVDRGYNRVSKRLDVVEPMRLPLLTSTLSQRSEQKNSFKLNIVEEPEQEVDENRSSLLMLEPLLLMSSRATARTAMNQKRGLASKKQLAHSEHLKLIKIVIAYSLTFLLLVSITFYVVYFT